MRQLGLTTLAAVATGAMLAGIVVYTAALESFSSTLPDELDCGAFDEIAPLQPQRRRGREHHLIRDMQRSARRKCEALRSQGGDLDTRASLQRRNLGTASTLGASVLLLGLAIFCLLCSLRLRAWAAARAEEVDRYAQNRSTHIGELDAQRRKELAQLERLARALESIQSFDWPQQLPATEEAELHGRMRQLSADVQERLETLRKLEVHRKECVETLDLDVLRRHADNLFSGIGWVILGIGLFALSAWLFVDLRDEVAMWFQHRS